MSKKVKYFLLGFLLLGIASYQIVFLVVAINADFYTANSAIVDAFAYTLQASTLLLVVVLVCLEIDNLEEFNIDKFTFISLV